MKRICCLLSFILLLQLLFACSTKDEEILQPVNFYYINAEISYNTPNGVLGAEVREGSQFQNIEQLLREYLKGPVSSEMVSLIPNEVTVLSCITDNDAVYILLSSQFAELTGIKLTTSCSAMLLTVNDYSGIQTIHVRAEGSSLDDKDEFVLSMDDIILTETVTSENTKE